MVPGSGLTRARSRPTKRLSRLLLPALVAPSGRDLGPAADGISGLVVNQTVTAGGYDFYRIFSILWSEKPDSDNYSL